MRFFIFLSDTDTAIFMAAFVGGFTKEATPREFLNKIG